MPLDLSLDCTFAGPALSEPFVKFNLETELNRLNLLPKTSGAEARASGERWQFIRRKLNALVSHGGSIRVQNHVIEPLLSDLGYTRLEAQDEVQTREGSETGGSLLLNDDPTARLRVWCVDLGIDLDAPAQRGLAYRFSHTRIAQRVLLTTGERLGILTNGLELRLLISDPARVDSQVVITLDPHWKRSREVPDSLRFFIALASPGGVKALPELIDKARLQQAKVTKDLREQARNAIREFIQELLDHPQNQTKLVEHTDKASLARALWHEGLITVYRLLFILKLESTDDPARSFSFASTSLWRNTFSPSVALAPIVRKVLDHGAQTGSLLQGGIHALFSMFAEGLQCTELNVRPMAGALFSPATTPILGKLHWTETAIARLLDNLLWTGSGRGATARERVHYGPLDVEDLGRVYEALLELEPGISTEEMCRLRRAKLEVVVPSGQGERYRRSAPVEASEDTTTDEDEEPEEEESSHAKKTKVQWVEQIAPDRFYLRVGLGRKATGSFYTPHSFVRFLVQETLGALVQRVSPSDDPKPCEILKLKVIDKAMGSGHFLVEACRFLGEKLYEAARRCDEEANKAEKLAESYRKSEHAEQAAEQEIRAVEMKQRVIDLPDPDDELLRYLPSRSVEGAATGVSQKKALALCRRMVAVHCLYGVDKNPLAVELAKLALWIECHAEGLPLTFLDHRLVVGNSLTGPFFEHLLKYPGSQQPLNDLFTQGLTTKLTVTLAHALEHIRALEASVGMSMADIEAKLAAKARLDQGLLAFKVLAAAWSGGVMLGPKHCDDSAYGALAKEIVEHGQLPADWQTAFGEHTSLALLQMVKKGLGHPASVADGADIQPQIDKMLLNAIPALAFDLAFPEVFYADANLSNRLGFDAELGNPPWDKIMPATKEFFAGFDLSILEAPTAPERDRIEERLRQIPEIEATYNNYWEEFESQKRVLEQLFVWQNVEVDGKRSGAQPDLYRYFSERALQTLCEDGRVGLVLPSAFHANEGATGVRQLYLNHHSLICCFSFENKRKLFEIHSSFKFAAIVAQRGIPTETFSCAFYLHDDEWLFAANRAPSLMSYSRAFVESTDSKYISFVELRNEKDHGIFEACIAGRAETCEQFLQRIRISCGEELNKTRQSRRFEPFTENFSFDATNLMVEEGRNIWQFDDRFTWPPASLASVAGLSDRLDVLDLARYFRFGYRLIASSTNERTLVACILPPGITCTQSISVERGVKSPRSAVLLVAAIWNSFPLDFLARQKVAATVNKFLLEGLPIPNTVGCKLFLIHSALRLTCNHPGYEPLWNEQLGNVRREPDVAVSWPVLPGDHARWAVRAAIDAVVAHAYGLTRDQYAHVLSTFSHSSYNDAPRQCLAAFDELQSIGLEAFTKKHDPYWDIPLNENLPQPVIELPVPQAALGEAPRPRTGELFDLQTTAAPMSSGELLPKKLSLRNQKNKGGSNDRSQF